MITDVAAIHLDRQLCTDADAGAAREWLVTDGLGGFAMGTAAGVRTRRYHGLHVVATAPPIGRRLGLVALDAVVVIGDRRIELGVHEWASGALAPLGHEHLLSFSIVDGVPQWRWGMGDVVIERELAMVHGRSALGVVHRLVRAPAPLRIELSALVTWRDVHGERRASGVPRVEPVADGFVFEGAYRVHGPGFVPAGEWYLGVHHREEAARGLAADEDVWCAGRFVAELAAGDVMDVRSWAAPLDASPPAAEAIVATARRRARAVATAAGARSADERLLAHAADQLVVDGPTVVAGYPWFGDWSRDTMTSYEGLFLDTNRVEEGRALLQRAAASVSEGMLANTADVGGTEYNTVDAAPWFLHVVGRHVERTGDVDLGASVAPALQAIVDGYTAGTRFGIRVDGDGLVTQGAPGWALTWMDARVGGQPITPRVGKPIEVNALWISGLGATAALQERLGIAAAATTAQLADRARRSFAARFTGPAGLYDVVDGPDGDDATVRPNQLLAAALLPDLVDAGSVWRATSSLRTSVGLRSLAPEDPRYLGRHRGGPAERDRAYHQGTVWPWLVPAAMLTARGAGVDDASIAALAAPLLGHLNEDGLGSVSETFDGDAPHGATGCPFQAWSVAGLLRALRVSRP